MLLHISSSNDFLENALDKLRDCKAGVHGVVSDYRCPLCMSDVASLIAYKFANHTYTSVIT